MKVGTVAEVRNIDEKVMTQYGLTTIVLMENAGREIAESTKKILGGIKGKRICVVAGKGNNGGDAFVTVRHLLNKGAILQVFTIGEPEGKDSDCRKNYNILRLMNVEIVNIQYANDIKRLENSLLTSSLVIDGILGTGFHGETRGILSQVIDSINQSNKPVLSIDIPSGIDGENGFVASKAIKADYTVTMVMPKLGMFLYPALNFIGEMSVADIGVPLPLLEDEDIKQNVIQKDYVAMLLPKRAKEVHKGNCGKVGFIAGSIGMAGSVSLASRAAIKSGVGIAKVCIEESIYPIVSTLVPEAVFKIRPNLSEQSYSEETLREMFYWLQDCNAVVIGPGLGSNDNIYSLVRIMAGKLECHLLLDADGINAFIDMKDELKKIKKLSIITPHPGELARLLNVTANEVNNRRIYYARLAATKFHLVVVLKGANTIVALPNKDIYINLTGTAAMATGGAGDVLSGVIASFLAQGLSPENASILGVYIHGLAGEIAIDGAPQGLNAMAITGALPKAMLTLC